MRKDSLSMIIVAVLLALIIVLLSPTISDKSVSKCNMRDYQLSVDSSGAYLYDGNRLVGHIPYTGKTILDSLIDKDNQ